MDVSAETPLVAPGADQKRVTARRISGNYLAYLAALRHCERSEAIQPSGQVAALPAQLAPAVQSGRTPHSDACSTVR